MKKNVDQAWLEEPWFDALKPQQKLAWFYVWTKSDLVGVWSGNAKIANIQIGYEIKWEEFQKALGDRVKIIKDGKWWLTEYCPFQFGTFSPESRVHMAAKRELNKHGISDDDSMWIAYPIGYPEPTGRLIVNTTSQSHKKGSAEGKQAPRPTREEAHTYGSEIQMLSADVDGWFDYFESNGWRVGGKAPMRDWKAAMRNGKRNSGSFKNGTHQNHTTTRNGGFNAGLRYDVRPKRPTNGTEGPPAENTGDVPVV